MKEHLLSFDKAKQFCDRNQMDLDEGKAGGSQAMEENTTPLEKEKTKKGEEKTDMNGKEMLNMSYKELQDRCEKTKTTMRAAEEIWKNVKKDEDSSNQGELDDEDLNQERLQGLKKMADIIGCNLQTI